MEAARQLPGAGAVARKRPAHAAPESTWDQFVGAGQGYAAAAVARETAEVVHTPAGGRNHRLNVAAYNLGQLVGGGELSEEAVREALLLAAQSAGLPATEALRTIASGLRSGMTQPRHPPERPASTPAVTTAEYLATTDKQWTEEVAKAREDLWESRVRDGDTFVFSTPERSPVIWGHGDQVAWAGGEALMICGPSGVGKSTVAIQLVAARLGILAELFGLPVTLGSGRVLYLAMDRPPQLARAMRRLFTPADRAILRERLLVWTGPPPLDLARHPEVLLAMARRADADTVIVDSLKDAALKLSDDDTGSGYNRARQIALAAGVELAELHHQRKAGSENKSPSKLDDVYGSTWITSGAGSVFLLWGEPGDPAVELRHLKQPVEQLGPWVVVHEHEAGTSHLREQLDVVTLVRNQGHVGMPVSLLAKMWFLEDKPSTAQVERARRRLMALERQGVLEARPGDGRETRFFLAPQGQVSPGVTDDDGED